MSLNKVTQIAQGILASIPPSTQSAAHPSTDPIQSARRFARLLDDIVRVPGTNISIGLDPLLNLIPFAGDAAGTAMSAYLLLTALNMGVPKRILLRMFLNIGVDTIIGAIPVVGQFFDFVWKSNTKNMTLLERYATMPNSTARSSTAVLIVVFLCLFVLAAGAMVLAYQLLSFLASLLNLPLW